MANGLNRFGMPEWGMTFADGTTMTVTQAEAYADAVIQRVGLTGKDLGNPNDPNYQKKHEILMLEKVVPAIFGVLHDAGEITPVKGVRFAEDGPEVAKMLVIATGVGSILGFNRAANQHFGLGRWSL